jgi:hypothetical protein
VQKYQLSWNQVLSWGLSSFSTWVLEIYNANHPQLPLYSISHRFVSRVQNHQVWISHLLWSKYFPVWYRDELLLAHACTEVLNSLNSSYCKVRPGLIIYFVISSHVVWDFTGKAPYKRRFGPFLSKMYCIWLDFCDIVLPLFRSLCDSFHWVAFISKRTLASRVDSLLWWHSHPIQTQYLVWIRMCCYEQSEALALTLFDRANEFHRFVFFPTCSGSTSY